MRSCVLPNDNRECHAFSPSFPIVMLVGCSRSLMGQPMLYEVNLRRMQCLRPMVCLTCAVADTG
ncbi:hypothetical protein BDV39DRAFT_178839 [Aspergillus sergii]|uniref:Uncharacterized protein n=1 Tax=Aspergillus sergii TaxID=1034303 RepID=A0A5N6WYX7_9EURO|nr:hypothetical protein BDV39DRAFT_178839 [Aspergillus sergii]